MSHRDIVLYSVAAVWIVPAFFLFLSTFKKEPYREISLLTAIMASAYMTIVVYTI